MATQPAKPGRTAPPKAPGLPAAPASAVTAAPPSPAPSAPEPTPPPAAEAVSDSAIPPGHARARKSKKGGPSIGVWLDFEKPIAELEAKIAELKDEAARSGVQVDREVASLEEKAAKLRVKVYSNLTRYQRVQLARHPRRPYALDFVERLTTDWTELHGDRGFADDRAIVAGLARFRGRPVAIVATQKGRDTKENLLRRFGMSNPEGYRKALRIMQLASNFGVPVISLIDTAGAYPGIGAEERGQAEAIARNLREMSRIEVPFLTVITGEGGSGGALALAMGDVVLMLENAIYSVISPEGCASILWRDRSRNVQAADALKLAARDCLELGVVDEVIPEPVGGAHRDYDGAAERLGQALALHLERLDPLAPADLVARRRGKYRAMGVYRDPGAA